MARSRNAELLSRIPLFKQCGEKELSQLAGLCAQVEVAPGEALTREGAVAQDFFVLLAGTAEVHRNGGIVANLGPGDHIGELALLDQAPRSATVTATSPVTALVLGPQEFHSALSSSPGLDRMLLASLAHQLREARGSTDVYAASAAAG